MSFEMSFLQLIISHFFFFLFKSVGNMEVRSMVIAVWCTMEGIFGFLSMSQFVIMEVQEVKVFSLPTLN